MPNTPENATINELTTQIDSLGYTKTQLSRVTRIRSPVNTLKKLIELHPRLTQLLFNRDEIIKIAAHQGGANNLEAINEYYQKYHDTHPPHTQLSRGDLVKIVGHGGGSINLDAVIQYYQEIHGSLQPHEQLTRDDLLKIVSHGGGQRI